MIRKAINTANSNNSHNKRSDAGFNHEVLQWISDQDEVNRVEGVKV